MKHYVAWNAEFMGLKFECGLIVEAEDKVMAIDIATDYLKKLYTGRVFCRITFASPMSDVDWLTYQHHSGDTKYITEQSVKDYEPPKLNTGTTITYSSTPAFNVPAYEPMMEVFNSMMEKKAEQQEQLRRINSRRNGKTSQTGRK